MSSVGSAALWSGSRLAVLQLLQQLLRGRAGRHHGARHWGHGSARRGGLAGSNALSGRGPSEGWPAPLQEARFSINKPGEIGSPKKRSSMRRSNESKG